MEDNKELEVVETAEEKVEETKVEETTEAEETAEEKVEETKVEETTEAEETAEEKVEETPEEVEEPKKKVRKKLDKTNIIVIAICAVVVLACFGFLGYKLGWFDFLKTGEIELDYTNIEVAYQQVEVTDEYVDSAIEELMTMLAEEQQIKEGVVEDGDTVNIDYVGKLASTGEAFDGGTGKGHDLVIGSGVFIEGFEEQLIGMQIGTSKTISVTFPEEYQNADLAGAPATFDVTVNYKTIEVEPELTDKWVKENASKYIEGEFSTVEEFKKGVKEYLYKNNLHAAMFADIKSKQKVKSYNAKQKKELEEIIRKAFSEQATYYQYTEDQLAQLYGAESAEAYISQQAELFLDDVMPLDKILKQEHLKITDKQVDEYIQRYLYQQGLDDEYTVEQIKEEQGDTWVKYQAKTNVKYEVAMTAIEKYVKFIDASEEKTTQPASN